MWTENHWLGSYINQSHLPQCSIDIDCFKDFWYNDRPAFEFNDTKYEEEIFKDQIIKILDDYKHKLDIPLFIMYAPRIAHYPLQVPVYYQAKYNYIKQMHNRLYVGMVNYLDNVIKSIVNKLKKTKRWDNTLLIFTSDNGGVVKSPSRCYYVDMRRGFVCPNGEAGANNYPLRGGKYNYFEGGIKVPTFVSGGFLDKSLRGTYHNDIFHIADWYATLAHIVNVDPYDYEAEKYKLPPIDSINLYDSLFNKTVIKNINKYKNITNKRNEILIYKQGIIIGDLKLLTGVQHGATWSGKFYPNVTTTLSTKKQVFYANTNCFPACLFNVTDDPTEHKDISGDYPTIVNNMLAILQNQSRSIFYRQRTGNDPNCVKTAKTIYGGYIGPYREIDRLSLLNKHKLNSNININKTYIQKY